MILDLGVSPDRILYANPIKQPSHIQYAANAGVDHVVFDSESELHKMKKHFPSAKWVKLIQTSSALLNAYMQWHDPKHY